MRRVSLEYRHWQAALDDPRWRRPSFGPREMACQGTGKLKIDTVFMDKLQAVRWAYGKPIAVHSGYRTPGHILTVTSNRSKTGAHTYARAADIRPEGGPADVPLILSLALTHGMTRCGLMLSRDRWKMHLDDMTAEEGFAVCHDRQGLYCWTY